MLIDSKEIHSQLEFPYSELISNVEIQMKNNSMNVNKNSCDHNRIHIE